MPSKTGFYAGHWLTAFALVLFATAGTADGLGEHPEALVYKSPYCGCCVKWIEHLEAHGYTVETVDSSDMNAVKKRLGVPKALASCHTAVVNGTYVIEGHVPAEDIRRLFESGSDAHGLAVPGMPGGSPGMESAPAVPYDVLLFDAEGKTEVYARHGEAE